MFRHLHTISTILYRIKNHKILFWNQSKFNRSRGHCESNVSNRVKYDQHKKELYNCHSKSIYSIWSQNVQWLMLSLIVSHCTFKRHTSAIGTNILIYDNPSFHLSVGSMPNIFFLTLPINKFKLMSPCKRESNCTSDRMWSYIKFA